MQQSLSQMAGRVEAAMHSDTCECEFCLWCRGKVKAMRSAFHTSAEEREEWERQQADAAYGDPAYEELNGPAERCS